MVAETSRDKLDRAMKPVRLTFPYATGQPLRHPHQVDQREAEHGVATASSTGDVIAMAIAEYRAKYTIRRAQRERDRRVCADRRLEFDPLRVLTLGYDRRSGIDRRQTFETVIPRAR